MKAFKLSVFFSFVCTIYIFSVASNIPSIHTYKENNLSNVSKVNKSNIIRSFQDFVSLELKQGIVYTKDFLEQYTMPILELSAGCFIIDLSNNDQMNDLFNFFSPEKTTPQTTTTANDGVSFKRSLIDTGNSSSSTSTPVYLDRFLYSPKKHFEDKLRFVIFHLSSKVRKDDSFYSFESSIDTFTTYEVSRNQIYSKYRHDIQETFTPNKAIPDPLFLLEFINTKLDSHELNVRNIRTHNFIMDYNLIDFSKRKTNIITGKIEAYKIVNNENKTEECIERNYNGKDIKSSDTFLQIKFIFGALLNGEITKQFNFGIEFCVLIDGKGKYTNITWTGNSKVSSNWKEIGNFVVSRIGNEYLDILDGFVERLNNGSK
eukprot:GAHX01000808.1.p1 GENE.GAHX01000808.1~~GAHX01000808.1.p1  ORF type:complete len:374 (+),score=64.90 GAHX01000808.1:328-1449(+)